jgi:hypothetical protein
VSVPSCWADCTRQGILEKLGGACLALQGAGDTTRPTSLEERDSIRTEGRILCNGYDAQTSGIP